MSNPIKIFIDVRYGVFQFRKSFKYFYNTLLASLEKQFNCQKLDQLNKICQLDSLNSLKDYFCQLFKDQDKFNEQYETIFEKNFKKIFRLTQLINAFEKQIAKYNETNKLEITFFLPYKNQLHLDLYQIIFKKEEINKKLIYVQKENINQLINTDSVYVITHNPKDFPKIQQNFLIYLNSHYTNITKKIEIIKNYKFIFEIGQLDQIISQLIFQKQQQLEPKKRIYKVGYYILSKKAEDENINQAFKSIFPVYLSPLDLRLPISLLENLGYQGFLHKISDIKKSSELLTKDEQNFIEEQFQKLYNLGKIAFCDPPKGLTAMMDRHLFQTVFDNLFNREEFKAEINQICKEKNLSTNIQVRMPKTLMITETQLSKETILEKKNQLGLKYPVICKTKVASATDNSHQLSIALNDQGLLEIAENPIYKNESYLIQELINHNAKIFKVYTILYEVILNHRKSLPNLNYELVKKNSFQFLSQQSFASQLEFLAKVNVDEIYNKAQEIDLDILKVITKFIHNEIDLGLYGYDIVIEDQTGDYYFVDINYFPGYKQQPDIAKKFHNYFIHQIEKLEKSQGIK